MSVPLLRPDWPTPARVRAAMTLRGGGVSHGAYASLNLGDHVGDATAAVAENRARVAAALGLLKEPLWLRQVHGATVVRAESATTSTEAPTADACVAFTPARPCVVLTADCLPVLICDRTGSRVAAAHAGWRGLAAGVLQVTVTELGTAPDLLMAWLGPAIGPAAFEVGSEVRDAFVRDDAGAASAFRLNARGRWQADLYELARRALRASGVTAIYGGGHCTHRQADAFFSYRRDGETGRMGAFIWLRAEP